MEQKAKKRGIYTSRPDRSATRMPWYIQDGTKFVRLKHWVEDGFGPKRAGGQLVWELSLGDSRRDAEPFIIEMDDEQARGLYRSIRSVERPPTTVKAKCPVCDRLVQVSHVSLDPNLGDETILVTMLRRHADGRCKCTGKGGKPDCPGGDWEQFELDLENIKPLNCQRGDGLAIETLTCKQRLVVERIMADEEEMAATIARVRSLGGDPMRAIMLNLPSPDDEVTCAFCSEPAKRDSKTKLLPPNYVYVLVMFDKSRAHMRCVCPVCQAKGHTL